jgi:site-specific DNA-methyltransferase (cytosine-N4-specific)
MGHETVFLTEDATKLSLEDNSVDLVVTSPPYFGIDPFRYGGKPEAQINFTKEKTEMLDFLLENSHEVERVLKLTGSFWVNIGAVRVKTLPYEYVVRVEAETNLRFLGEIYWDYSRNGEKEERLGGTHGLWLHFAKDAHQMYFNPFMIKRYSSGAWALPGNNQSNPIDAQLILEGFALDTFPEEIPTRFIEMFTKPNQVVLDPFGGTGVAAMISYKLGRKGITNDISEDQVKLAKRRLELVKESK